MNYKNITDFDRDGFWCLFALSINHTQTHTHLISLWRNGVSFFMFCQLLDQKSLEGQREQNMVFQSMKIHIED